jgi:hypothetical protein
MKASQFVVGQKVKLMDEVDALYGSIGTVKALTEKTVTILWKKTPNYPKDYKVELFLEQGDFEDIEPLTPLELLL